jgi:hypothetical protein
LLDAACAAAAAAAAVVTLQLAQERVQKGRASFQSLSKAISKALELSRLHPHLDARDLLHPAIAQMQLSYVDRAVRRMRHVLPDTKLRAELLAKGVPPILSFLYWFHDGCLYVLSDGPILLM